MSVISDVNVITISDENAASANRLVTAARPNTEQATTQRLVL